MASPYKIKFLGATYPIDEICDHFDSSDAISADVLFKLSDKGYNESDASSTKDYYYVDCDKADEILDGCWYRLAINDLEDYKYKKQGIPLRIANTVSLPGKERWNYVKKLDPPPKYTAARNYVHYFWWAPNDGTDDIGTIYYEEYEGTKAPSNDPPKNSFSKISLGKILFILMVGGGGKGKDGLVDTPLINHTCYGGHGGGGGAYCNLAIDLSKFNYIAILVGYGAGQEGWAFNDGGDTTLRWVKDSTTNGTITCKGGLGGITQAGKGGDCSFNPSIDTVDGIYLGGYCSGGDGGAGATNSTPNSFKEGTSKESVGVCDDSKEISGFNIQPSQKIVGSFTDSKGITRKCGYGTGCDSLRNEGTVAEGGGGGGSAFSCTNGNSTYYSYGSGGKGGAAKSYNYVTSRTLGYLGLHGAVLLNYKEIN